MAASDKGKPLGAMGGWPGDGEIADNIFVREEGKNFYLQYCIIVRFGSSIKLVTEIMMDYLEDRLRQMFPDYAGQIRIKVVGVKSKHIAERDIEVIREWN